MAPRTILNFFLSLSKGDICFLAVTLLGLITQLRFPLAFADNSHPALDIDITHTDIDDLLKMQITSVSKVSEPFWDSAAAIYVLTNEKIRRSGATSIPEVLRLVPGVEVARIDANKWAVSIRGFNSRSANKLLVLIDGRSIYDQLFSGVLWETKDVMLEDVERIEVIGGPGGTLWGANAVNGVINIITKSAKDTQGGLVTAGGGTEERGFGSARYGTKLGEDNYLRFYGKYQNRDSGFLPGGADDESQSGRGGFRFDKELDATNSLTFQGDLYDGTEGNPDETKMSDEKTSGGNLLFRWNAAFSKKSMSSLLAYYDHTKLDLQVLGETRDTLALDLQHFFQIFPRHRLGTGLHYRYSRDDLRNTSILALDPSQRSDTLVGVFAEDKIDIITDTVFLTLGSKVEHNDFTGFEAQPTARVSWNVNKENFLWAAVSHAVRVPSRLEHDFIIHLPPNISFQGNHDLKAEDLLSYELGWRSRPREDIFLDLATYYNVYDKLVTTEGFTLGNKSDGETYGIGAVLTWQPVSYWHLKTAYTFLQMNLALDDDSLDKPDTRVNGVEGSNPRDQYHIQSVLNITPKWEIDAAVRYVESLPALGVRSYTVADLHVGYQVSDNVELSVVGQNLFDKHHFEQARTSGTAVEQGVYGKVRWRF